MPGYCTIEIYDTVDETKESFILNPNCSSYIDYVTPFIIDVQYKTNTGDAWSKFLADVRGRSYTAVPSQSRHPDPILSEYDLPNNTLNQYNNNWGSSVQSGLIAQFASLSGTDGAIITPINSLTDKYYGITCDPYSYTGKVLFEVNRITGDNYIYNNYKSNLEAWASYDLSLPNYLVSGSGIVSYAIEIVKNIILPSGYFSTGQKSGILPYINYTGLDVRTSYTQYCIDRKAIECKEKEMADKVICYTGVTTGAAYQTFVSNLLKQFANQVMTPYDEGYESNEFISSVNLQNSFGYWSGELHYNDFVSGDRLNWNLYNFDYTGVYSEFFYTNPLVPSTGFSLTYPRDFSNIDELVSGLNRRLESGSYPVWYDYECVRGSGRVGLYQTGALMTARKLTTGTGTGIISFHSLRNLISGYNMYFDFMPRNTVESQGTQYTGLRYMLPSAVLLEGSYNGNDWFTLNENLGINWSGLEPQIISITGQVPTTGTEVIMPPIPEEEEYSLDATLNSGSGQFIQLFSFTQEGFNKPGAACAPQLFSREISVVYPSGFSGVACKNSGEDPELPEPPTPKPSGDPSGNITPPVYNYEFLRTGWNLINPQNTTLPAFPYYDYSHYRVRLTGFSTENDNMYMVSPSFYIKNINLFYGTSGVMTPHTGKNECIIGSDYTLEVMGPVLVTLTGTVTGYIPPSQSGVDCFFNAKVSAPISGLQSGSWVKFNNESGRLIVNNGTGYLTDCIYATGCFSTGIVGWFYDPVNETITFQKTFETCIGTGASGQYKFSGDYYQVDQAVINAQLAIGGFGQDFNVTITTGIQFTGLANTDVLVTNVTGIYNYTGITGGYAALGYFQLNSPLNVQLNSIPVDFIAGGVTGYANSQATLHYGNPQEFDWIAINSKTISYNSDSGSYSAPDYFATSGQLLDIINSNPLTFFSSGYVENGNIKIVSLLSGATGNTIPVSAGRGTNTGINTPYFDSTTLSGGADLYRKVYGTGTYTGNLSVLFYNSGFYSATDATGIITGLIPTFQGERSFTGVWGMSTGNFYTGYMNFLDKGLTGENCYVNIIGGPGYAVSPQNIDLGITFIDQLNTQSNSDIVRLTISGMGISGISYLITGIYSVV